MRIGQKIKDENIGSLGYGGGIVSLSASTVNIGGLQVDTDTLQVTLSALANSTKYNLFVVMSTGIPALVYSTNAYTVGPNGYNSFKHVGSFTSTNVAAFSGFDTKAALVSSSDLNPVGMIISSLLTEAQFQALNGTSWVLADGRNITGSLYSTITSATLIPDLRGQTLRGKNNGRVDGNQDPDGERALGAFQSHAFGSHDHTQGSHNHGFGTFNGTALPAPPNGGNQPASTAPALANGVQTANYGMWYNSVGAYNTTVIQGATPAINPNGANETRMRNIAVNHFIKIN